MAIIQGQALGFARGFVYTLAREGLLLDTFRWMELTSRGFKRYILGGGDMAALPVGSMEVMGPHLPVGSKTFITQAIAEELCRIHGGLCLPAIPLSPICGAKEQGGVGLDFQTALDYVKDVVCEAHENGIRRMLLVGFFDELYYVMAEVFQEYDIPLVHIDPGHLPFWKELNRHRRFNMLTAGSLKLLGENGLLARMLAVGDDCLKRGGYRAPDDEPPIAGLLNINPDDTSWCSGVLPHRYGPDEYKILPSEGVDATAAAAAIRDWAGSQTGALAALSSYSQVFARAKYDRGMRMGGVGYGV
jgi:hypothetical protein